MAHGRPWYKRSGSDFVMGTLGMPDAEHKWAYSAIVDMLNDRDRPLADDPGFLCGFTGLSRKKWSVVRSYLIREGYLYATSDGYLTNPRFERERSERQAEHDRSVEAGKKGGRASAAKRQAELDLEDQGDYRPVYGADKHPDSTPDSGIDTPEIDATGPKENKDLGQAPPQPSRAREEARGESLEDSPTTASIETRAGQDAVAGDGPTDLHALTNDLCKLGAVAIINHSALVRELDVVKGWIGLGYDIDALVRPTIAEALRNTKQETIGTLNFYSQRLARQFARAGGRTPEQQAEWTPERKRQLMVETIARYRTMGRDTEADDLQAKLDRKEKAR